VRGGPRRINDQTSDKSGDQLSSVRSFVRSFVPVTRNPAQGPISTSGDRKRFNSHSI
jgi:hypothetical protein